MAAFLRQIAYTILISGVLLLALNLTVGPSLGIGPNALLGLCCGVAGVVGAVAIEEIYQTWRFNREIRTRQAAFAELFRRESPYS